MKTEKAICVTKRSVDDLIVILNRTISLLDTNITNEYTELVKDAKSEREIYRKVQAMMEDRGSTTLCMMISDIPSKKGIIKVVSESEEDVDISEVAEPKSNKEIKKVNWTEEDQEKFQYYSTH